MSYITIPKQIKEIESNSKPIDAFVWATLRSCSDYKNGISHAGIEKLVKLTGVKYRTIQRSIHRLEEAHLLKIESRFVDENIRYNAYDTNLRMRNYFMLDRKFFQQGYTPKIAGFILLLKCICVNGKNTIGWNKRQIADGLGISRNTVSSLLDECIQLGIVEKDEWGYNLTGDYFINDSLRERDKDIFAELEKFCEDKGSTLRPYKSKNRMALDLIGATYRPLEDYRENPHLDLRHNLEQQCPTLPKEVSVEYFLKPLRLQHYYDKYQQEQKQEPAIAAAYSF